MGRVTGTGRASGGGTSGTLLGGQMASGRSRDNDLCKEHLGFYFPFFLKCQIGPLVLKLHASLLKLNDGHLFPVQRKINEADQIFPTISLYPCVFFLF